MKNNIEMFCLFISEQKVFFEKNLSATFEHAWDDDFWNAGKKGTGWLQGRGIAYLRFDGIRRIKGITSSCKIEDKNYTDFMKAMLVAVYRKNRNSISPAVAVATLIILKRWYYSLIQETGQTHPIYLTTAVLDRSMEILDSSSDPADPNVANYKGRCLILQKLVNIKSFTLVALHYVSNTKYTNKTNLTKKAQETIKLKKECYLNDDSIDDESSLLTIKGFLNIVSLINNVETNSEKICLNCLLLLIVTGFRSVEAFNLRRDALVKHYIKDKKTIDKLEKKGVPNYFLGIKYIGVKGAGKRTHWVEPLAVPLVESIFKVVTELTKPMRKHLAYLRSKGFVDYLPAEISNNPNELIELDDITRFVVASSSANRGRGGRRDSTLKILRNRNVYSVAEKVISGREKKIFLKKMI